MQVTIAQHVLIPPSGECQYSTCTLHASVSRRSQHLGYFLLYRDQERRAPGLAKFR